EHADPLEVRPAVAGRLDSPALELAGQIGGGQTEPLAEDGAPLELVGREVGKPVAQLLRLDPLRAAASGRGARHRHGTEHRQLRYNRYDAHRPTIPHHDVSSV